MLVFFQTKTQNIKTKGAESRERVESVSVPTQKKVRSKEPRDSEKFSEIPLFTDHMDGSQITFGLAGQTAREQRTEQNRDRRLAQRRSWVDDEVFASSLASLSSWASWQPGRRALARCSGPRTVASSAPGTPTPCSACRRPSPSTAPASSQTTRNGTGSS